MKLAPLDTSCLIAAGKAQVIHDRPAIEGRRGLSVHSPLKGGHPGSVSKIPERKLPEQRCRAVQAKIGACRCIVTVPWGVSRGSPAPEYRTQRATGLRACRGCSTARNGGKVSDATFAACSDLISVSIRARRPSECCCARASGEARTLSRRTRLRVPRFLSIAGRARLPGGDCAPSRLTLCASRCDAPPPSLRRARAGRRNVPCGVRLAVVSKRALDFHPDAQLPYPIFNESQPFAELSAGSRICRHPKSFRVPSVAPWRSTWS